MAKFGKCFAVLFLLSVFFLNPASAADDLIIHGLVSQGYLKSSENNYMTLSEGGSTEYSEFVINFQKQMDDKLRLGLQLMSRDLGKEGNNEVKVDWGYGDYKFNDRWGLRLGRVKVPFGFYNKGRDIDMLRTTVLLPATIYMEDYRQFLTAFNGGSVYANLPAGKGDFEFEFAYGGSDLDPDSGIVKDILLRFNNAYETKMTAGLQASSALAKAKNLRFSHVGDPERGGSTDNGYSAKILWNTPVEGLKIGGTRTDLDLHMDETLVYQPIIVTNPPAPLPTPFPATPGFQTRVDLNYKFLIDIGSLEYTINKFTFSGELMAAHGQQNFSVSETPIASASAISTAQTSQGSYLQCVYRHNDRHEWSLYRGEFFFDRNNKVWNTWQKDTCASFRYNVNPNWSIKIEHHWIDGIGLVQKNLNTDFDRKWNLIAIKTTYNF